MYIASLIMINYETSREVDLPLCHFVANITEKDLKCTDRLTTPKSSATCCCL